MLSHLTFASPWLLACLAALPLLWWLLRLTPPAPKAIRFPPLLLLKNLITRKETPARTPWWLLLLRLTALALIILAFADPQFDRPAASGGHGDLLLVVDNDWAAARDWDDRRAILTDLLHKAARDKRAVALLTTAAEAGGAMPTISSPIDAEGILANLNALTPEPWSADRRQTAMMLTQEPSNRFGSVVWLASGLGSVDDGSLADALKRLGPTKIYTTAVPIYTLQPPTQNDGEASLTVLRAGEGGDAEIGVAALSDNGDILTHLTAHFVGGAPRALVPLDPPAEIRNRIARFEIDTERTAASTALLDAGWQHREVGITGDAAELDRHSLLSEVYYLDRALKPFADLHIASLQNLIAAKMPVIIMTDAPSLGDADRAALDAWLKTGGTLVRFAGERFAGSDHADEINLLPVPVRSGRSFGGTMSWGTPQKLQAFPAQSPFHALTIPKDVTVSRQVLAEPSADLAAKSWAELEDGTPLVTAATKGQGLSILFHVPALTVWSNLPLSGLFVEMLEKIVTLSRNNHHTTDANGAPMPPYMVLDAFGEARTPEPTALPLSPRRSQQRHRKSRTSARALWRCGQQGSA